MIIKIYKWIIDNMRKRIKKKIIKKNNKEKVLRSLRTACIDVRNKTKKGTIPSGISNWRKDLFGD